MDKINAPVAKVFHGIEPGDLRQLTSAGARTPREGVCRAGGMARRCSLAQCAAKQIPDDIGDGRRQRSYAGLSEPRKHRRAAVEKRSR